MTFSPITGGPNCGTALTRFRLPSGIFASNKLWTYCPGRVLPVRHWAPPLLVYPCLFDAVVLNRKTAQSLGLVFPGHPCSLVICAEKVSLPISEGVVGPPGSQVPLAKYIDFLLLACSRTLSPRCDFHRFVTKGTVRAPSPFSRLLGSCRSAVQQYPSLRSYDVRTSPAPDQR